MFKRVSNIVIPLLSLFLIISTTGFSQSLNWEGQTGALLTPFAYTAGSPATGIGHPVVSFHYLNAGDVVGDYFQISATVGLLKRAEFGYTRTLVSPASTPVFSSLFDGGFNTFHGKINVVTENTANNKAIPAISVGFVARTNLRHVGGVLTSKDTTNGDIYFVATKTITQVPHLPILLSGGVKGSNASLMGIAGNAPDWKALGFGAAAFVLNGPAKSKVVLGAEAVQQPAAIKDLPGAVIPTSLSYFARIVPIPERPFNLDLAIVQAAGRIAPGVDLNARARFGMGMSYRF